MSMFNSPSLPGPPPAVFPARRPSRSICAGLPHSSFRIYSIAAQHSPWLHLLLSLLNLARSISHSSSSAPAPIAIAQYSSPPMSPVSRLDLSTAPLPVPQLPLLESPDLRVHPADSHDSSPFPRPLATAEPRARPPTWPSPSLPLTPTLLLAGRPLPWPLLLQAHPLAQSGTPCLSVLPPSPRGGPPARPWQPRPHSSPLKFLAALQLNGDWLLRARACPFRW